MAAQNRGAESVGQRDLPNKKVRPSSRGPLIADGHLIHDHAPTVTRPHDGYGKSIAGLHGSQKSLESPLSRLRAEPVCVESRRTTRSWPRCPTSRLLVSHPQPSPGESEWGEHQYPENQVRHSVIATEDAERPSAAKHAAAGGQCEQGDDEGDGDHGNPAPTSRPKLPRNPAFRTLCPHGIRTALTAENRTPLERWLPTAHLK